MMDAIKLRRSIRKFEDKPIGKDILNQIINAGKYAPSAKNDQPWRFIVITNKNKIKELSKNVQNEIKKILKKRFILQITHKELRKKKTLMFLYGAAMAPKDIIFFDAPALIFIVTKKNQFYDESCACCAQNMMLYAHSLDIGSCWIGFASFLSLNKQIIRDLGVPEGYHISAALIFGYGKNESKQIPLRKPMVDVINRIE